MFKPNVQSNSITKQTPEAGLEVIGVINRLSKKIFNWEIDLLSEETVQLL